DIVRLSQVMKDEGFEEDSFSSKFDYLLPSNSIPSTQRNPYESSERLFKLLQQKPIPSLRNCNASSDSGNSSLQHPANVSSVSKQWAEDNRKSENSKSRSKSEPPIRRNSAFPPKETSFNFIPFKKSLVGDQQSLTCSNKDNSNVSMIKSASKNLISTKANDKSNKVQMGATFTLPENEKLLLKKKEKGAEDSCVINLVGPRLLPTSANFENKACEKSKNGEQRSPISKSKIKKKAAVFFLLITATPASQSTKK
ncbi:hypothetical protein Csa_014975, partial [Cucumis sativus]